MEDKWGVEMVVVMGFRSCEITPEALKANSYGPAVMQEQVSDTEVLPETCRALVSFSFLPR